MRWIWVPVSAALLSAGCGSVSTTLPPALHIPQRVIDLSAVEQGKQIVVQFTMPTRTIENLLIQKSVTADLRIGPASAPFRPEVWAASARSFTDIPTDEPPVKYGVPATEWVGKSVVIAVQILNDRGRTDGWSNMVVLSMVPPLSPPRDLQVKGVAEGVRLTWQGDAPRYRVYRRLADKQNAVVLAETDHLAYTDTTSEYEKTYHYSVEGFHTAGDVHAISERTAEVAITPIDIWPPPVPTGIAAVASPGRVELVWDRSVAPDLAGYRIYRAEGDGPFAKIGETREGPSYSDLTVAPGKTYRYAVSAFDQTAHESEKSAPVPIQTQ